MCSREFSRITALAIPLAGALIACGSAGNTQRAPDQSTSETATSDPWQEIERLARPTVAPGDPALIQRASQLLEPHEDVISDRWTSSDQRCWPVVWPGETSEAIDQSVAALVDWHRSRGGLARVACPEVIGDTTRNLFRLLPVVQAALMQAEGTENHANLAAALYLGHRLRQEGNTLLHVVIGSEISHQALLWARDHGRMPAPEFEPWRPGIPDLLRAIAVEAACQVALVASLRDPESDTRELFGALGDDVPESPTEAWIEKEIAAVQRYSEEMFTIVQTRLGPDTAPDDEALASALEALVQSASQDRQSLFLPMVAAPRYPSMVQRLLELDREYNEYLDVKTRDALTGPDPITSRPCTDRDRVAEQDSDLPESDDDHKEPASDIAGDAELDAWIRRIDDTHHAIERANWDKLLADGSRFARNVRIVPSVKNGKADGFKLYAMRPGSVLRKLGFRNGDTIHAINGHDISTPDKALEVYTRLRDADKLEVSITRRGEPLTITIDIESSR